MYRQYEKVSDLEDALKTCRGYIRAIEDGEEPFDKLNDEERDELMRELKEGESDLKERINFAYQDEEFDEMW